LSHGRHAELLDWSDSGRSTSPSSAASTHAAPRSDADRCRSLYRHVLLSALEDFGYATPLTRLEAARWLRFPNLDCPASLTMVCEFLNIPGRGRPAHHALRSTGLA
jgi:hypothetical protein